MKHAGQDHIHVENKRTQYLEWKEFQTMPHQVMIYVALMNQNLDQIESSEQQQHLDEIALPDIVK